MSEPKLFISYAQNGEDVLLRRALRNVENGCYVDIGAADPVIDSVTCAFYQAGWRGLNIEPSPAIFEKLAAARPADINLNLAAGDAAGSIPFYLIEDAEVLSTAVPEQLQRLTGEGFAHTEIEIPVRRLDQILAEHALGAVHFCKIDVEGFELNVLAGADFQIFRPWIILIEATEPNAATPTHEAWEHFLLGADYRFVWFDGLNRFYIAAEHPELAAALTVQPNVFDRYMKYAEALARAQLAEANFRLAVAAELQQEITTAMNTAQEALAAKKRQAQNISAKTSA